MLSAEYEWDWHGQKFRLNAVGNGTPSRVEEDSLENFITEHYWGYSAAGPGKSIEYRVSHDPWRVWTAAKASFEGDGEALYGRGFGEVLHRKPDSAFIAEGSPVTVHAGRRIA